MPGMSTVHDFLQDAHVPYTVLPHLPAFTALDDAAATHVPGPRLGESRRLLH